MAGGPYCPLRTGSCDLGNHPLPKAARWGMAVLRGRIHRKAMRWIRPLAFFGGLPPPMEHERKLAAQAVATARIVIHRETPHAQLDITWVRLTLPDARWAHVLFSSTEGKGWFCSATPSARLSAPL